MPNQLEQQISNYFGIVKPKELELISALFKEETLAKGDYFQQQGEACRKLSFIKSGLLRIYKIADGKEVTQWISTPGYFVTDLSSFVFQNPSRWIIQALSDAELYTISQTDYNQIGSLLSNWHELEKLFMAKCFVMVEDRVFSHLSYTAEERYNHFFEQNKELFNQVPLQYIASMLGMSPETLSRIRKKQLG
jgi:CRP-like cAMP-binding protein